jgi:hypothetical protein
MQVLTHDATSLLMLGQKYFFDALRGFRDPSSCPERSCFSFCVSDNERRSMMASFSRVYGSVESGVVMTSATSAAISGESTVSTW